MAKAQLAWRRRQARVPQEKSDRPKSNRLSEGVLIALVPFIGSTLAFLYEAGYLWFFSVPQSFIKLDLPFIIQSSMMVLLAGVLFIAVIQLAQEWRGQRKSQFKRIASSSILYLVVIGGLLFAFRPDAWREWLLLLVCFGVLGIVLVYGEAWWLGDRSIPFDQRVDAVLASERWGHEDANSTFMSIVLVLVLGLAVCSGVFQQGVLAGKSKTTYWVLKTDQTLIFIEQYGENALFRRFDGLQKKLLPELQVRKVGDGAPLEMVQVEVEGGISGRTILPTTPAPSAPASASKQVPAGAASALAPAPTDARLPSAIGPATPSTP